MWNQWSQYAAVVQPQPQPPLPLTAAPPPPPSEPAAQTAPPPPGPSAQPPMIGPMPPTPTSGTMPPAASVPNAAASNPYSQYTAAQYAALTPEQQYTLQQHWQQWQKYQEEYAKWHAQYGEQYKREMEAASTPTAGAGTYPAFVGPVAPTASQQSEAKTPSVATTKITGQPQLYSQPPPQVGHVNQYSSTGPTVPLPHQQPPPPPPSSSSQPPYQQQPPAQWQGNQSFFNQPPPNFNSPTAPPNNYQNMNPTNQWTSAPPPFANQGNRQPQPPPVGGGGFNNPIGNFQKSGANDWNNGPPTKVEGFAPDNMNNRGRPGPNSDNNQYGRRSGPPNAPPNQEKWDEGPPNRGNQLGGPSDDWQQGSGPRGGTGPNDWRAEPTNKSSEDREDWGDTRDNSRNRNRSNDRDNWKGGPPNRGNDVPWNNSRGNNQSNNDWGNNGPNNSRDSSKFNDWNDNSNNRARNNDSNNWRDGPNNNNRGGNNERNNRHQDFNSRNNFNPRGDDDNGDMDPNRDGDFGPNNRNRFSGGWNDGPNGGRNNNRNNDWSDNRGNDRNSNWGDNRGPNWSDGPNSHSNNNWNNRGGGSNFGSNNQQQYGPGGPGPGNTGNAAAGRSVPDIDEEKFDRQFKQWEEQFEDWKKANANHPDREMYTRYEQEFEKQRIRIMERREQMRRRKMERLGLDPNQPPPNVPNNEGAFKPNENTEFKNNSRDSSQNRDASTRDGKSTPMEPGHKDSFAESDAAKQKSEEAIQSQVEEEAEIIDEGEKIDSEIKDLDTETANNQNKVNATPISIKFNVQKATPLGKRTSSRFSAISGPSPNKMKPLSHGKGGNNNPPEIINLDDDDDADNINEGNNEGAPNETMAEIFKKTDGIPGLDLVEDGTSEQAEQTEDKVDTQPNKSQKIPSLFDVKIDKPDMGGKANVKGNTTAGPMPDISKTLNDPEFMKKISEALAKAQGKDDGQQQREQEVMRDASGRPLSYAEWQSYKQQQNDTPGNFDNDNSNDNLISGDKMSTTKSVMDDEVSNASYEHSSIRGDDSNRNDNFGPNNCDANTEEGNNWGPNNAVGPWANNNRPNNWGPNGGGGPNNNWGRNSGGGGPNNNWGPNSVGGPNNNWGPNSGGGGPNNNWGPNNQNWDGPNNNNRGGPNNWGYNGPNNNGGPNNWGPNNNRGGGPNNWGQNNNNNRGGPNNWGPNNNGGPNNCPPFGNNGPWGNNGGGPFGNNGGGQNSGGPFGNNGGGQNSGGPFGNNGGGQNSGGPFGNNGGGPNNWGPNNNNFGQNFRGANNRNIGPNNSKFGPNGPDSPNFGGKNANNADTGRTSPNFNRNNGPNFGNNNLGRNFGRDATQNTSDLEANSNPAQTPRNVNNPFRRNESSKTPSLDGSSSPSPWKKGPGDNLDYGDYFRPVQVIDYTNNASVATKVIEYGHKPVADDFKPMKVINYDHAPKPDNRANLMPPGEQKRQNRGRKRKNRKKQQQRVEQLQNNPTTTTGPSGTATNNQQKAEEENNVPRAQENEEQLEDISDNEEYLPDEMDEEVKYSSPAPPPPPMYSGGGNNSGIQMTSSKPETVPSSSIFPSTAEANENIAKMTVDHVQMSIPTVENNNTISIEEILIPPGRDTRPKKICIILRGPPGSGKSYVAKLIKEKEKEMSGNNPRVLSIDDYFLIENDYEEKCPKTGKKIPKKEILYEYDKEMEETYMQYLIKSFKKTIIDNFYDFIVIDCNNNSLRTLNEFYCHAKDSGYVPYIIDLFCDLEVCLDSNIHERSEADIKEVIDSWKPTPFHYIKLDVASLVQNVVEMEDVEDMPVDDNTVSENADTMSQTADDNGTTGATTADYETAKDGQNQNDDGDDYEDEEDSNDSAENHCGFLKSKWETDTTTENLARLDGTRKLNSKRKQTMEEYLQVDEWQPVSSNSKGKKRVRWADIEEKREQEKMRAVGFVVGQTDWKRMMDPNAAKRALNKTKYIERVNKQRR